MVHFQLRNPGETVFTPWGVYQHAVNLLVKPSLEFLIQLRTGAASSASAAVSNPRYSLDSFHPVSVLASMEQRVRDGVSASAEEEKQMAERFYLSFTTPALTATVLLRVADPILRVKIGFAEQQFGPVRAAFDHQTREVTAYGPVTSLNLMLRELIWYWEADVALSERVSADQILLVLTAADSLNLNRVYNKQITGNAKTELLSSSLINLAMISENASPTRRKSSADACPTSDSPTSGSVVPESEHLLRVRTFVIGREKSQRLNDNICDPENHKLSFSVQCRALGVVSTSVTRYFKLDPGWEKPPWTQAEIAADLNNGGGSASGNGTAAAEEDGAAWSGCPGFIDVDSTTGLLRIGPSDESFWGFPNEDGNPEGAYFVKVIATDPYAGRYEHVVEIYVGPTLLRLFSMLWQFLTIIGTFVSTLFIGFYGRAMFFNLFRKKRYICAPRFLKVRAPGSQNADLPPDLEEFHLCKPDEAIVREVCNGLDWRDYFGVHPDATLDIEKLKLEVERRVRSSKASKVYESIPAQAQLRWRGRGKATTHVAVDAVVTIEQNQSVDAAAKEGGEEVQNVQKVEMEFDPDASSDEQQFEVVDGNARLAASATEKKSDDAPERPPQPARKSDPQNATKKLHRADSTMSQINETLQDDGEIPLSVLLRTGARSFGFILKATALKITKDRHNYLCEKDDLHKQLSAKALRRMGDLRNWAFLKIKEDLMENVPVLQLNTTLTWNDEAFYCDWTRVFCKTDSDLQKTGTDFQVDHAVLQQALEEIKAKKGREAFYRGRQYGVRTVYFGEGDGVGVIFFSRK